VLDVVELFNAGDDGIGIHVIPPSLSFYYTLFCVRLHVCAATAELAARIPEHIKQVIQVLLINAEREARAEADGRGLGPVVIDS
jgi:hypothetical protein